MIKLKADVYTADKNNSNVQAALQKLQSYVTTHMNTSLDSGDGTVYPPIQLKYTYDRLLQQESSTAATNNTQLYTDAQNYCQSVDSQDFSGHNRVPCVEQYVENHDTQLPAIPTALYEFDFSSPTWSPDLAGWSMVSAAISLLAFLVCLAAKMWAKRNL